MIDLSSIQDKIGYTFSDEALLITALTHSSYTSEHGKLYSSNNERLEFIGDAYLDAIIGHKIYDILRDAKEGVLSRKRADIVCETSLAEIARELDLGSYLLLGNGEELTGGRDRESMLGDALEALIGAVIIDGGFAEGKRVVLALFEQKIRDAVQGRLDNDYKSKLQEMIQKKYRNNEIVYRIIDESGPAHDKSFTAEICFKGKVLGRGTGKSKAKAEQSAAMDVITKGEI